MKTVAVPKPQRAAFKNGDTAVFDRYEEHDDLRLFFRHPIGLVYSSHKDNIISYDYDKESSQHDSSNPGGGQSRAA